MNASVLLVRIASRRAITDGAGIGAVIGFVAAPFVFKPAMLGAVVGLLCGGVVGAYRSRVRRFTRQWILGLLALTGLIALGVVYLVYLAQQFGPPGHLGT